MNEDTINYEANEDEENQHEPDAGNDMLDLAFKAEERIGKELVQFLIEEIKAAPDVWQKLPEHQQQDVIWRAQQRVGTAVAGVVNLLMSTEQPTLRAHVEKVVFKGGIEAVMKIEKHSEAKHDLADAEGTDVVIVITDPVQYLGNMDDVKPDPDQQDLIDDIEAA